MGYYFADYLHDQQVDGKGPKGQRTKTVKLAVKSIEQFFKGQHPPDFIAVCGCSGLSVGSIIAYELGIPCVIVRKEWDAKNSHCGGEYTTPNFCVEPCNRYVIVDDFIASGNTVQYIKDKLKQCECVGFYSYTNNSAQDTGCREQRLPYIEQI